MEYQYTRLVEWVTTSAQSGQNVRPDIPAHLKEWTDAGWELHTMTNASAGEVYMGYSVIFSFIWKRMQ